MRKIFLICLLTFAVTGTYIWSTDNRATLEGSYLMFKTSDEGFPVVKLSNIVAVLTFTKEGHFFYQRTDLELGEFLNFRNYEKGTYKINITGMGGGYAGDIKFVLDRKQGKNPVFSAKFINSDLKITFTDKNKKFYRFEYPMVISE